MRFLRRIAAIAALAALAAGFLVSSGTPAGGAGVGPVATDSGFTCLAEDIAGVDGLQVTDDSNSVSVRIFGYVVFARSTCRYHLDSGSAPAFGQLDSRFFCEFITDHGLFVTYNTTAFAQGSIFNGAQTMTVTCTYYGGFSNGSAESPATVRAGL